MLRVADAVIGIGDRTLLTDVNLCVEKGEVHALIGPNAAGKTSLLSSIAGLEPYRILKGRIHLKDEDITDLPPHERVKRGIVLAYQNPPPFKGLTLRILLDEIRKRFGLSKPFMEKLAGILSIEEFMDRELFNGMSGGERKRLETFLALVYRPSLALLDEPDSGVDIDSVKKIVEAIHLSSKSGTSLIVVTHSMHMLDLLKEYVDRVHLIYGGTLLYSGLYDEVVPVVSKYGYGGAAKIFLEAERRGGCSI